MAATELVECYALIKCDHQQLSCSLSMCLPSLGFVVCYQCYQFLKMFQPTLIALPHCDLLQATVYLLAYNIHIVINPI